MLCRLCGLGGCLLAAVGMAVLVRFSPPDVPRVVEGIHLDGIILGFTALLTLTTGLVICLVAALQASNPVLSAELAGGARGTTGVRRGSLRSGLVIAEMAVSLMLLVGAGLMIRSFARLLTQDFGFNPEQLVTMNVNLPAKKYTDQPGRQFLFDSLLNGLRAVPGVKASGGVMGLPLSGSIEGQDIELIGAPPQRPGELLTADYAQVSPSYFAAMKIPLMQGRDFTEYDATNSPLVLIVNETFIRQFKLGTNVLGRRLKVTDSSRESEIIGVVKDVKGNEISAPIRSGMYRSYRQVCRGQMTLVIRTQRDPSDITLAVRAELDRLDKDIPLESVRTMTQLVASTTAPRRLLTVLLAGFAGVALLLAAIGLYGVLAGSVSQRTREIGIRTALGAQRGEVIRLILRQGMKLAGVGILLGLSGAFVLTQVVRSMLYDVAPTDPLTFTLVPFPSRSCCPDCVLDSSTSGN